MVEAGRVLWLVLCDREIDVSESSGISTLEDRSSTKGSVTYNQDVACCICRVKIWLAIY